jgi:hypothetical protein
MGTDQGIEQTRRRFRIGGRAVIADDKLFWMMKPGLPGMCCPR